MTSDNANDIGVVGFIGCGQMGGALLDGWLRAGRVAADQVRIVDAALAGRTDPRFPDVRVVDATTLASEARTLVLAVKPAQAVAALASVSLGPQQLVISVCAGVPHERLAAAAAPARVVRTMPNTPARVGQGATMVLARPGVDDDADIDRVASLFEVVGLVERAPKESWFHAATAVAGSGPAYVFVAIEALADGGVAAGLPRAVAQRLAARAVLGAGALASEPGAHPGGLKDQVTSPAGTTAAALGVLERRAFRGALLDAVVAAADRSRELEDG